MATDSMPAALPLGSLPVVGQVVAGKYRIERMIAEGGMGIVYEAMHLQLDELVAIKFLRADFVGSTDGEIAGRFMREARASAKIRSEHVTRVHDVGTLDNGAPYIVMERLHGQDLESLVDATGVLSIELGIDYMLQACEALAEAHAIGIVHRDLKPANLFLTHRADGSSCVKVLDFGISKFKDGGVETNITKTHAVMGSPRYMSPEQMRSSRDVDARADVWAIGIILYELFAGTVPFDGESMPQICAAILQDEPKSLHGLRPQVTPELEAIVARCLQKKAADRYESIAPLARALSAFGSVNARASAERIARVLRGSIADVTADTAPREFTVPSDSGPLPSFRIRASGPEVSAGSATALEWTGTELAQKPRKKTAVVLAAAGLVLVGLVGGVATIAMHGRSGAAATTQAPLTAPDPTMAPTAITITHPADSTSAIASAVDAANANPAPTFAQAATPTTSAATPTTTKSSTKKPSSSHAAAAHANAGATAAPANPPATTAKPATTAAVNPGDMWDERK
jgi:serine/threonine-protein kinase